MSEFKTPAGRLVQGMLTMQQRKDITTKQPVWKDAAKTIPDMGTFFSLAFPKMINGAANPEFGAFYALLVNEAATSWPALFPQGAGGACTDRRFSWKLQDGDGSDFQGQSVAGKPGFAGHWIVKFDTNFPIKVYNEGHFAPHEELQQPEKIVKRGYWVRVMGEVKSNMATGTQVPGIVLYPNLVSFLGGNPKDEIVSGPDAQTALGGQGAYAGWRPDGISTVPGAPSTALPNPGGAALPGPGGLPMPPASIAAPVAPQYQVRADLAAQGHTLQTLAAHGTPEQLVAAGYITVLTPAPAALPSPGLPTPGGLPGPGIGAALPTPGLPTPGGLPMPGAGVPLGGGLPAPGVGIGLPPAQPAPVAGPQYALIPALVQQGVSIEKLFKDGWNWEALVAQGHATRIG